jgi:DNA polymerase-3 subunit epsilon
VSIRDEHEEAAKALEETGDYRILRRLPKWQDVPTPADGVPGMKVGAMIDVETTGLDHTRDKVIELGLVLFNYDRDGTIYSMSEPYQGFQDPGFPIPPEITEITGITDDMVRGKAIDLKEVEEMLGVANFVVAHNAAFDRKFVERIAPIAETKPWGCSMTQVPWQAEGINARALETIVGKLGYFYDAHSAVADCKAAVFALSRPLPKSGRPALAALREVAAIPTARVWAEGADFDLKDVLKARGYQWNPGDNGKPKSWYRDVPKGDECAERKWLMEEIYRGYGRQIRTDQITFYERFSVRG